MSTEPQFFDQHVFICTNRRPDGHPRGSCAERGAERLCDHLKERVHALGLPRTRINSAGCLGVCDQGPVLVIYPEGVWYSPRTVADITEIIESHLMRGEKVERLRLRPAG